jgi:hypothetical protein
MSAHCPTCRGDGSDVHPFDGACPTAWAHQSLRGYESVQAPGSISLRPKPFAETADTWDPPVEEYYLRALHPLLREIVALVKEKLPPHTHFGVLVLAPNSDPKGEGRVLAATTDRDIMATVAAQWALTVLPEATG